MMLSEPTRSTRSKSPTPKPSEAQHSVEQDRLSLETPDVEALNPANVTLLKPDNVLALQRTYGNQATQRLLANGRTAKNGVLQAKLVPPGRVKKTGASFISTFTMSRAKTYQQALTAGMKDNDIANLFQALLDSDDEYSYMDMERTVAAQIENQVADTPQSAREVSYGGVTVTPTSRSFTVQPGQTTTNNGTDQQIHTKWILVDMDFLVESPDEHVEDWEFGFIQTVTSSDRSILLTDNQNRNLFKKLQLPGPRRDGGSDTLMPWFKDESVMSFGKQKVQAGHVHFEDRPGFGLTLDRGDQLNRMNGTDRFKLVLALRKKDGSDIKMLHTWVWRADYDTLQGDDALGITVEADGAGGDDQGLVFDGSRARNDFTTTDQYLTGAQAQLAGGALLPNQAAFAEMKTNAKKKKTPFSGMLPVKSYGKLVTEFNKHVENSRWAEAKVTIDKLLLKLDPMNNIGTEYWLTGQLKARYFDPIYRAAQQQQQVVQGKLGG